MEIAGRVAIVTGAARGIGRSTARLLALTGARAVVLADLDRPLAEETAEFVREAGAEALVCETDVGRLDSLRALFAATEARFGALHVLNNNAAIAEGSVDWPEVDPERAAAVVDVNLRGTILGTRLALEPMRRSGGGAIVNTASGGAFQPSLPQAAYVATKAGIVHFTRSCAGLAASHGVRVSCVCPGMVDTPGLRALGSGGPPAWLQEAMQGAELLQPETVSRRILTQIQDPESAGVCELVLPSGVSRA